MSSAALRVLVTRPAAQAAGWVDALRAEGVDAVALPLIAIDPPADPEPARRAWDDLGSRRMVFFVSPNAVQHFFALAPAGAAWPSGTLAAAPGPGTVAALRAQGVPAACVAAPPDDAPSFDADALWQRLRTQDWTGRSVLIVRGDGGRDGFAETLRGAGATVDAVAAYRRRAPILDAEARERLAQALAAPARHLWLFSSSEAIGHLQAIAPGAAAGANALATHPRIADSARRAGFARIVCCSPMRAEVTRAIKGWSIQSLPL